MLAAVLSGVLFVPVSGQAAGTGENEFGVSPTLFATLAAINAAGYDDGMNSPLNERYKVRAEVRKYLAGRDIPSLSEVKAFYKEHKKPTPAADLGQYISFALLAGDPPKFLLPTIPLPPDVEPLRPFSEIMERFYKEADLHSLWVRTQPAYNTAMAEYQEPVINTLFEANGYLRNPSGEVGRRFQVYLDLLGAPDQVQVRSYRSDFYVVITPASVPEVDEIRDAYLAYVLDPLTFKYAEAIKQKKDLQKIAQEAPALDLAYKDDFSLLVTKCLIKAIDSRLMHEGAAKREAWINQSMREGYILTAGFAEQLLLYERQPDAFRMYYPTVVSQIDVKKEEKRLKNVQFVESASSKIIAPPSKMEMPAGQATLEAAEGAVEQRDVETARKLFKKVFEETSDKPLHGRAYYGLALIDLQEKQWDQAVDLFERAATDYPKSSYAAWSHYYLGQLQLKAGNPEKATAEFNQALATEGITAKAREAVEKALQTSSPGVKQQ
jgi:predicted negative regulator of RcsB-dependent stress response